MLFKNPKICIKFTNDNTPKTVPLTRKKYKKQYTAGAVIHIKALVHEIYATVPTLPKTCRLKVELFKHPENNRLVFDLEESLII